MLSSRASSRLYILTHSEPDETFLATETMHDLNVASKALALLKDGQWPDKWQVPANKPLMKSSEIVLNGLNISG